MSLLNKLTRFAKQNPDQIRKLADKAQEFAKKNPDKVRKIADTADQKTGGKYRSKIDDAVRKLGADGPGQGGTAKR